MPGPASAALVVERVVVWRGRREQYLVERVRHFRSARGRPAARHGATTTSGTSSVGEPSVGPSRISQLPGAIAESTDALT